MASESDEISFNGVVEVFDAKSNALSIAAWSTTILLLFITAFAVIIFINYVALTPQYLFNTFFLMATIATLFFGFSYFSHLSGMYENMTLNSDLGYRNIKDTIVSVYGGSLESSIEREVGYLRVSKKGISGIIKFPWKNILNIRAINETTVHFQRKTLFGSRLVTLRFKSQEDAEKFINFSKQYFIL